MSVAHRRSITMKRLVSAMAVVTVLGVVGATNALAQRGIAWRGGGGWGPGTAYAQLYNPQTVETISGEVIAVDRITPMSGMAYGVHLRVKTDKETISVHLGPGWYIENQDAKILPKDKITVKGSRITFEGKPAIIAATVTKGDDVMELRDARGFPAWSGWRRK
jgi:hypothetical protein